ncbi:acylphosphatase [Tautonia sociabilis]|uniref:Uncharacterized protein n=1 Tax=Tautonia sociabilis TaxID=2080755 RepID=A0A432MLP3_9BACT|nr:hypothetical protein [Tautonia sociabilis]RUL88018.1 hypothetical protein TsocGM_09865 [Tautonia sociabilis]
MNREKRKSPAKEASTKQTYRLAGKLCPRCHSAGPFLLDPSDDFIVVADGSLEFPPGEWGLDIDCDCAACGFAGRLEDFCEWVEVTGEERATVLRVFLESRGPRPVDGFNRPPAKESLPETVARAIEEILWHYWEAEHENFIADEPGPDEEHIFRHLVAVDGWFEGYEVSAEQIVAEFTDEDLRDAARRRARRFRGE